MVVSYTEVLSLPFFSRFPLGVLLYGQILIHAFYIPWKSDPAYLCKSYAKLYFDVKYLKEGFNRGWGNFRCHFFQKKYFFWPISEAALPMNVKLNISLLLSSPSQLLKDETTESQSIAR